MYPHVATGFSDSNAYLRELTLKSMLVLAPKLSQKTLNQSLLKFLAKLQVRPDQMLHCGIACPLPGVRALALNLPGHALRSLPQSFCLPTADETPFTVSMSSKIIGLPDQVDEEPGIRANTTILLGNLAGHLSEAACKRVLLNAFTRALRDAFPPARIAGVKAGTATFAPRMLSKHLLHAYLGI